MYSLIAYKNPRADDPACRHSGLGITASNIAEVLSDNHLPCIALPVANGEALWAAIRGRNDITHVAICAPFFDTEFLERMVRAFPYIKFTCTYHSNYGFLQVDYWAVKCLVKQLALQNKVRNFRISGNCLEFVTSTELAKATPIVYLPNLYYLRGQVKRARGTWSNGDLHLGIFGATRVLKNVLTGVAAGFIVGRSVASQHTFIHTSSGRVEHGDGVMETVRKYFEGERHFELVEEPWSPWPDFQIRVRQMDLLLQPSYSESFNNVTADGVCEGVPSVVGFPISWVPDDWRACPDNAGELAKTGVRLLNDPTASPRGYEALAAHNRRALAAWCEWLQ